MITEVNYSRSWALWNCNTFNTVLLSKYGNMQVLFVKVSKPNIAYRSIIHLFSANYTL